MADGEIVETAAGSPLSAASSAVAVDTAPASSCIQRLIGRTDPARLSYNTPRHYQAQDQRRLKNRHTRRNNALQARQVVPSTSYACQHDAFETHNGNPFLPSKTAGAHSMHRRNMRSMSKVKKWKSSLRRLTSTRTRSSSAVVRNPRRHN
jgi:hypothetical protein